MGLVIYIAVKYVAYAAWCIPGARLLRAMSSRLSTPLFFGFIRLLIGACFGIAIFFVGSMMHLKAPGSPVAMYFAV